MVRKHCRVFYGVDSRYEFNRFFFSVMEYPLQTSLLKADGYHCRRRRRRRRRPRRPRRGRVAGLVARSIRERGQA